MKSMYPGYGMKGIVVFAAYNRGTDKIDNFCRGIDRINRRF